MLSRTIRDANSSSGRSITAGLSRTHAEIEHQISLLRKLLTGLTDHSAQPEDVRAAHILSRRSIAQ